MANIGQELLNVPFPEMVEQLGMSIAKAQFALDMNSMKIAQVMSGSDWFDEDASGKEVKREGLKVNFGGRMLSLLELGFTPTFYQFVDTIIEVKISVSMASEATQSNSTTDVDMKGKVKMGWGGANANMHISTVSASFSARNSFSAEGASLIRTKLVPLPPPAVLQDRIRALMEEQKRKEILFDPAVIEVNTSSSTPVVVLADVELKSVKADRTGGTVAIDSSDKKKLKITADSSWEAGVMTVTIEGEGNKKGMIKVIITKPAVSAG